MGVGQQRRAMLNRIWNEGNVAVARGAIGRCQRGRRGRYAQGFDDKAQFIDLFVETPEAPLDAREALEDVAVPSLVGRRPGMRLARVLGHRHPG